MQAAGGGVGAAAELAAGVQLGDDDLDAGEPGLGLDVDRDAAAVVADLDATRRRAASTSICVQWPASASSTALSMISHRQCMRPRLSVDPMYMPGRLRTASRPSSTTGDGRCTSGRARYCEASGRPLGSFTGSQSTCTRPGPDRLRTHADSLCGHTPKSWQAGLCVDGDGYWRYVLRQVSIWTRSGSGVRHSDLQRTVTAPWRTVREDTPDTRRKQQFDPPRNDSSSRCVIREQVVRLTYGHVAPPGKRSVCQDVGIW